LKFILPELLEKVETIGEVAWVNSPGTEGLTPGMGVRFVGLTNQKIALIQDVIKKIEGGKGLASIEE
jgi:Tfp pilus assembly protein PilZ